LSLTACGPDFSLRGDEFDAHINSAHPIGSSYAKLKGELLSQGFRAEIDNNEYGQFVFSNTQGIGRCGQIIQGSTSLFRELEAPSEKITRIEARQGCFRAFSP
jgi:hypothetical protein